MILNYKNYITMCKRNIYENVNNNSSILFNVINIMYDYFCC